MNLTLVRKQQATDITFLASLSLQKTVAILILITSIVFCNSLNAHTSKYRAMFGNDPSTEMTIGFDAEYNGTNPVLYYSTNPIDVDNLSGYSSQLPDKVVNYHGMVNCFVRLSNLLPGQTYYFVIKDNSGISEVYNFETISNDNNTQLSIIAGGDSRNNWNVRAVANKIVSKLFADAVMFDGDFVQDGNSPIQWQQWLDDWQLTINSNNRITPIIPARGNHENNDNILINLFDCPTNIIYTKTLGNNLLKVYTLNSEKAINYASTQTTWLENELANNISIWEFIQFHRPIRPHVSQKIEGSMQYAYWADLFYKYGVDAVLEGDSHTAKTTWPIIPCSGGFGCYEGFKRNDNNGTVYIGEGGYASPLRDANDIKPWTRDSGKFFQFKWIFVDKNKMEIRTVKYDTNTNLNSIDELTIANRFTIPQNLDIWNPSNGDVVTINKPTANTPTCTLNIPVDNEMYFNLDNITFSANATGTSAIAEVQFYVDGTLIGTDNNMPYEKDWQPMSNGVYTISVVAKDINDISSALDFSFIKVGDKNNIEHSASIDIVSDEYREYKNGNINYNSYRIEVCKSDIALQGLRFTGINIPKNAVIESATIDLVASRGYYDVANATIWCEENSAALPFKVEMNNITNRTKTTDSIEWNIPGWANSSVQTTPDLSSIIQKLVQRQDWSIESPMVFLIRGNNGTRRAISFAAVDGYGDKTLAPKLTVKFSIPVGTPGCTDIYACNFNPSATIDDGSCLLSGMPCNDGNPATIDEKFDQYCNCVVLGCTDTTACNYNSLAMVNDGSCVFPMPVCPQDCLLSVVNNVTLNPTGTSVIVRWDAIPNTKYKFHYRMLGEPSFRTFTTPSPIVILFGLDDCTTYEFAVKVVCETGLSAELSEPITYTTSECRGANENIIISDGSSLNVYPNPANGYIEIQFADGVEADLVNIYNTTGQLVIGQNDISFDGSIYRTNVGYLPPGIYIVSAIKDNITETKKILVK